MVLLGCTSVGLLEGKRRRGRLQMIQDMVQGLEVLEREFALNKSHLPDMLLKAAGGRQYERVRQLFLRCAQAIEKGNDFTQEWSDCLQRLSLDLQEMELLLGLCGILGRYDEQGQAQSVARVRTELEQHLANARQEVREKCRLYVVLGSAAGGLLSIVLV